MKERGILRLFFDGNQLDEGLSVADCGLESGDVIVLAGRQIVQERGGGGNWIGGIEQFQIC